MTSETSSLGTGVPSLVVAAGSRACAIPLAHAVETMRPLPIEAVIGTPSFVLGLAMVRGSATPVVHLGRLIGAVEDDAVGRFVTVRLGERRLALAVGSVLGVRELERRSLQELPSILGPDSAEVIEAVGKLDFQLLMVLRATRIIPQAAWEAPCAQCVLP